jgi:putative nucleotidyltransferase with HDIG domain
MLPSRQKCLELLHKQNLSEDLLKHSIAVEKTASFIAKKLKDSGQKIDAGLVSRAALLHDIGKAKTIAEGFKRKHGEFGKEILEKEGFPDIAKIVAKHPLYQILEKQPFDSLEEKVVYYADKRVKFDKAVSLDERLGYILEKYGTDKEKTKKILAAKPLIQKLEKQILTAAKIGPSLEALA